MHRIATPWDHFVARFSDWLDGAWYLWLGLAVCVVLVAVAVQISRVRARAQAKVPQYRRDS